MRSRLAVTAALGVLTFFVLVIPNAFARGGGFGGGAPAFAGPAGGGPPTWHGAYPPGFSSQGRRVGWGGGSTPPGWSKAKKNWNNPLGVPPGLYRHSLR
jgi:hypothetical protein